MTERDWKLIHSSKSPDWRTPPAVFKWLDDEFNFDLDAASSGENALCDRHLTKQHDALTTDWRMFGSQSGDPPVVFVNPPYGRGLADWIAKASEEQDKGCTVVMLVFACTDTRWWREAWQRASEVRLLTGRIRFLDHRGHEVNAAPKGSAVIVWRPFGGHPSMRASLQSKLPLVTLVELAEVTGAQV